MSVTSTIPETLEEAIHALHGGTITATQLVQDSLAKIFQKEGELHGFITVSKEEALLRAAQIDQNYADHQVTGILAGIPIAHKDVFFTKDIRTTAGSKVLSGFKPDVNAIAVQILEDAGAISLGKTNCHEFAFGSPALDDYFLAARNPWNPEHMPGSSSSGSATAVAAGYCFAATASDTGGSARHPAAACGLVGLKPTRDLIPKEGLIPLAPSLDTVGIITRNVRDNLIMLCAMVGTTAYQDFLDQLRLELPGIRIGVDFSHIEAGELDNEVREQFLASLEVFKELGAHIVSIELPPLKNIAQVANHIINYEGWQELKDYYHGQKEQLGKGLQEKLEIASQVSQQDYQLALEEAQKYAELLTQQLKHQEGSIDAILSIGRESPAQTMEDLYRHPTGARSTCNRLYSLTGHPAITIPMGFARNGMPLALQIAGQYHDEYLLYQVAHAFEQKRGVFLGINNLPWK